MLSPSGSRLHADSGAQLVARFAAVTALLVCCAPLFVLTLRAWASLILFLGALFSVALLLLAPAGRAGTAQVQDGRLWARALLIAWLAPVAAVALGAWLRRDASFGQFDAAARFVLAVPIFLAARRFAWPVGRALQWVLPLALGFVLLELQLSGYDPRYTEQRITTHVVDPLVFGYFSLAFGLMCLVSVAPGEWRAGGRWSVVLRLAGAALGAWLSIRSGSRSGWLAVPLVVGLWLHHHWGRGHRLASAGAVAGALLLPVAAYLLVPTVQLRVDEAVSEVVHYPWDGVLQHETSIGYRITYLRIAADLFVLHPWAGVGETTHVPPLPASAFPYAAPEAVRGAFVSGFHNQIVTNAIRSGVGGLLATMALLLVPLAVCLRGLRRAAGAGKEAMMGMAYCTTVFVASLGTEVVDLKFAASFYALMTAALCGAVLGAGGRSRIS